MLYEVITRQEAATGKDAPDLSDPAWYKNLAGLSGMNVDTKLITMASDIFRIISQAKVNNSVLTATAVVQRFQNTKTGNRITSYNVCYTKLLRNIMPLNH